MFALLALIVTALGGVGLTLWLLEAQAKAASERLRGDVEVTGMTFGLTVAPIRDGFAARGDGVEVRFTEEAERDGKKRIVLPWTRMWLGGARVPLDIEPVRFDPGLADALAGSAAIPTGDPAFDARYVVRGDAHVARAILDAPTRAAVHAYLAGRTARVEQGRVVLEASEHLLGDALYEPLLGGRALVRRLVLSPEEVDVRLATSVTGDPEAGVRRACLLALAERRALNAQLLDLARKDSASEVRDEAKRLTFTTR